MKKQEFNLSVTFFVKGVIIQNQIHDVVPKPMFFCLFLFLFYSMVSGIVNALKKILSH